MFYLWVYGASCGVAVAIDSIRGFDITKVFGQASVAPEQQPEGKRKGPSPPKPQPNPLSQISITFSSILAILLVISLTLSSLMCLYRSLNEQYVMFGPVEQEVGNWINKNLPIDAVILAPPDHRHPAIALAGRVPILG